MTHIYISVKHTILLQILACCLFGTKPLSEPMMPYCQLDSTEHISVKFYLNLEVFSQGNVLENVVYQMVAILSQPVTEGQ